MLTLSLLVNFPPLVCRTYQSIVSKSGVLDDIMFIVCQQQRSHQKLDELTQSSVVCCYQLLDELAKNNDDVKQYVFNELTTLLSLTSISDPVVAASLAQVLTAVFSKVAFRLGVK